MTRQQKAFSQKLTKGYTGVKKAFTLVRSRIFEGTRGAGIRSHSRQQLTVPEVPHTPSPGDDRNVEATMTKGDHMAAKHIPRALRPAWPAAAGPAYYRKELR